MRISVMWSLRFCLLNKCRDNFGRIMKKVSLSPAVLWCLVPGDYPLSRTAQILLSSHSSTEVWVLSCHFSDSRRNANMLYALSLPQWPLSDKQPKGCRQDCKHVKDGHCMSLPRHLPLQVPIVRLSAAHFKRKGGQGYSFQNDRL